MKSVETKDMEVIVAVIEEGTLSKAADKLYTTQPTVSRTVAKVEHILGTTLFDKSNTPWTLTYAGQKFADYAYEVLNIKHSVLKNIASIAKEKTGLIKIGLMPFEEKYLLATVLPKIQNKYPDFAVDIVAKSSLEIENELVKENIDVAIVVMHENNYNSELEYIPIKTYEILVALPLDHKLSANYHYPSDNKNFPKINLALLADYPFVLMKEKVFHQQIGINTCKKLGFIPKAIYRVTNQESAHNLAQAGSGATFILDEIIRYQPSNNKAAYFKIEKYPLFQEIAFAYKKNKPLTSVEENFLKILLGNKNNLTH